MCAKILKNKIFIKNLPQKRLHVVAKSTLFLRRHFFLFFAFSLLGKQWNLSTFLLKIVKGIKITYCTIGLLFHLFVLQV